MSTSWESYVPRHARPPARRGARTWLLATTGWGALSLTAAATWMLLAGRHW